MYLVECAKISRVSNLINARMVDFLRQMQSTEGVLFRFYNCTTMRMPSQAFLEDRFVNLQKVTHCDMFSSDNIYALAEHIPSLVALSGVTLFSSTLDKLLRCSRDLPIASLTLYINYKGPVTYAENEVIRDFARKCRRLDALELHAGYCKDLEYKPNSSENVLEPWSDVPCLRVKPLVNSNSAALVLPRVFRRLTALSCSLGPTCEDFLRSFGPSVGGSLRYLQICLFGRYLNFAEGSLFTVLRQLDITLDCPDPIDVLRSLQLPTESCLLSPRSFPNLQIVQFRSNLKRPSLELSFQVQEETLNLKEARPNVEFRWLPTDVRFTWTSDRGTKIVL